MWKEIYTVKLHRHLLLGKKRSGLQEAENFEGKNKGDWSIKQEGPHKCTQENPVITLLRNRKKKTGSDIHLVYTLDSSAKLPSIDF